jgi:hypothetical protein
MLSYPHVVTAAYSFMIFAAIGIASDIDRFVAGTNAASAIGCGDTFVIVLLGLGVVGYLGSIYADCFVIDSHRTKAACNSGSGIICITYTLHCWHITLV